MIDFLRVYISLLIHTTLEKNAGVTGPLTFGVPVMVRLTGQDRGGASGRKSGPRQRRHIALDVELTGLLRDIKKSTIGFGVVFVRV